MSPKLPLPIFRPSLYLFPTRSSNPALPPELMASALFFLIRSHRFRGARVVASARFGPSSLRARDAQNKSSVSA
jgi:hypothetical protein